MSVRTRSSPERSIVCPCCRPSRCMRRSYAWRQSMMIELTASCHCGWREQKKTLTALGSHSGQRPRQVKHVRISFEQARGDHGSVHEPIKYDYRLDVAAARSRQCVLYAGASSGSSSRTQDLVSKC
ncbi:uncharacterized protein L969DRAFT_92447 [Mixia osmundae IAM 14324]|uniref:uncharacterized protein n=1 Tax=Mixia osmundae (strain CBS 9802 / IAM 14324 / JCM 22182 / KY 12970) TaxID=764103 RepID=UPI0004A556F5|nr:uncharacterized protein L969DRAFT_92447 [Mixia osmundae IAM 14324]KEI41212.1 hypothetical protein L969DRAFT_92447 [Mixia osmundae IAM 14324]